MTTNLVCERGEAWKLDSHRKRLTVEAGKDTLIGFVSQGSP